MSELSFFAQPIVQTRGAEGPRVVADTWYWQALETDASVPNSLTGPTVLNLATWLEQRGKLDDVGVPLGVRLTGEVVPEALAGHLEGLTLIAIEFPTFSDGRGFSVARYLRQQLGWQGELRATGDVLIDTVNYLARCGFDSFQLKPGHEPTLALQQLRWFTRPYQRGYAPLGQQEAA